MRKEIGIDLGFIEGSITEVNIENRAKGIYVIQVWDGDKILKSLRFIRE
jgi:inner membrane protein involved in colicin E2 resistance